MELLNQVMLIILKLTRILNRFGAPFRKPWNIKIDLVF
uniref:Uncharacterized protein n=1 Tax=Arundo donax TaxID=35708 RepID=A0A0A9DKH7_ARUDO